jgi:hypothetical protein
VIDVKRSPPSRPTPPAGEAEQPARFGHQQYQGSHGDEQDAGVNSADRLQPSGASARSEAPGVARGLGSLVHVALARDIAREYFECQTVCARFLGEIGLT